MAKRLPASALGLYLRFGRWLILQGYRAGEDDRSSNFQQGKQSGRQHQQKRELWLNREQYGRARPTGCANCAPQSMLLAVA